MRVALAIIGGLLLLFIMVVGGAWWWWQENGDAFIEQTRTTVEEGLDHGEGRTALECHQHALERMRECADGCAVNLPVFAMSCFSATEDDGGLCDTVPHAAGLWDRMKWTREQCGREENRHGACDGLMDMAISWCEGLKEAGELESDA